MNDRKKAQELSFNRRYSRFKVQIFFPNRNPITHYGNERKNVTVSQIEQKRIIEFTIHRDEGLKDCIARIALCEQLYGRYNAAIIYDNKYKTTMPDGTIQKGREVIKYISGKLVEFVTEERIFSEFPTKIKVQVLDKDGKIDIVPIIDHNEIDFKEEISNAVKRYIKN